MRLNTAKEYEAAMLRFVPLMDKACKEDANPLTDEEDGELEELAFALSVYEQEVKQYLR